MDGDNAAGTKGWFADYQLRVMVAFIVAPIVVPASVIVWSIDGGVAPAWAMVAGFVSACVAYGGTLIVGIPLYRFLRARKWTYLWVAAALGYLVGVFAWFALFSILTFDETMSSLRRMVEGAEGLTDLVWPGGPLGCAVGVIMWLIARPDLDRAPPK